MEPGKEIGRRKVPVLAEYELIFFEGGKSKIPSTGSTDKIIIYMRAKKKGNVYGGLLPITCEISDDYGPVMDREARWFAERLRSEPLEGLW